MARIDINKYAFTPASVFDLNGRCWSHDRSNGVPCRIKVGPRRWLEEHVIPEELSVTIWQEKHGQSIYLQNEPVQTSVDKNGVLTVDMAAFAKEYFGKDHIHFCDSEHWKWYKKQPWSDTFLTADYGIAAHRSAWLDISVNHSNLFLLPGALNLCGHDVRHIYWETFCDELGAPGEEIRPLVTEILSSPHTVSAEDFKKRIKQLKSLKEYGFNRLEIRTDRGRFAIGVGLDRYLNIDLAQEGPVVTGYEPKQCSDVQEALDILLLMLQSSNADEIRAKSEDLHRNGLLVQRKDRKRQ